MSKTFTKQSRLRIKEHWDMSFMTGEKWCWAMNQEFVLVWIR